LDFVPGTYLLPHVTRALEALGVPARDAIARGEVRVLPATVEVAGERGRPLPFALHQKKQGGGLRKPDTLVNLLGEEPSEQVKQCREGYLGAFNGQQMPPVARVEQVVQTHNTVHEEKQRPTEEVGGVYSREAISPRQGGRETVLRSELRLRKGLVA